MKSDWLRVTKQRKCPVCSHGDWCGITSDGKVARCMRVESAHPSNGGWIHRLSDPVPVYVPKTRPPPQRRSFAELVAQLRRITTPAMIEQHADELGVSADMLDAMTAAWCPAQDAWAFPMWSGSGSIVGVRLRNVAGEKWAITGSKEGLFWPFGEPPEDGVLYVCEGPTDTTAAATLGLWAVGRPSCTGATEHLRELCRRMRAKRIVIIGDNDPAKQRPDGSFWYPGREGALALCRDMAMPPSFSGVVIVSFRASCPLTPGVRHQMAPAISPPANAKAISAPTMRWVRRGDASVTQTVLSLTS